MQFDVQPSDSMVPAESREASLAAPGFGRVFTDHMISARWTEDDGWHDARLEPYAPARPRPGVGGAALLAVGLRGAQGLPPARRRRGPVPAGAQRPAAGRLLPPARATRAAGRGLRRHLRAADTDRCRLGTADRRRVALPAAAHDRRRGWADGATKRVGPVPAYRLPRRQLLFRPAAPISLWLTQEYVRAVAGGTGAAKCGGNYAASLAAQREAMDNGCDQVVFIRRHGAPLDRRARRQQHLLRSRRRHAGDARALRRDPRGRDPATQSSRSPATPVGRSRSGGLTSTSGAKVRGPAASLKCSPAARPPWSHPLER